jgi:hypothetical protein
MAVNTINYRFQDSETSEKLATLPIYVPTGHTLAEYQAFADAAGSVLDNVSGAKIVAADLVLALSLTNMGIKANAVAGHINERGGLIGMENAGQWNDSIRIPAILNTLMSGDEFNLADPLVAAVTLMLTAGNGVVFPRTRDGFVWEGTGLYGKKSFRRK